MFLCEYNLITVRGVKINSMVAGKKVRIIVPVMENAFSVSSFSFVTLTGKQRPLQIFTVVVHAPVKHATTVNVEKTRSNAIPLVENTFAFMGVPNNYEAFNADL